MRHPLLASVFYLSDHGGPTLVVDQQITEDGMGCMSQRGLDEDVCTDVKILVMLCTFVCTPGKELIPAKPFGGALCHPKINRQVIRLADLAWTERGTDYQSIITKFCWPHY